MSEKEYFILLLNVAILFFQLIMRAEIKRLDEKINTFCKRLERLENCLIYKRDA